MPWPPRVKFRRAAARRRKRAARILNGDAPSSSSREKAGDVESGQDARTPTLSVKPVAVGAAAVGAYSCHYCQRSDGRQTRDHKHPRAFGGAKLPGNIVRCCLMCNTIKDSRPYALFVVLFGDFLIEHGEEYRAADADDGRAISAMARKFNAWLHALQHAECVEDKADLVGLDADATAGAS